MKIYALFAIILAMLMISGCASQQENAVVQQEQPAIPAVSEDQAINAVEPAPAQVQKCGNGITHDVKMNGFQFTPAELEISRCDVVLWTNDGTSPHTISDDSGEVKSAVLQKGDKYGHKFEKAGTFEYYCSIHPSMTGKIIVK